MKRCQSNKTDPFLISLSSVSIYAGVRLDEMCHVAVIFLIILHSERQPNEEDCGLDPYVILAHKCSYHDQQVLLCVLLCLYVCMCVCAYVRMCVCVCV